MSDETKKQKNQIRNQIEAGIFKVGDDLYNVRVSRRMKVSESASSRQFFRRRNNVKGLNQARRVKRELLDELSMEALKYEGKDVKWKVAREDFHKHLEFRVREGSMSPSTSLTAIGTVDKYTKSWDEKWLSTITPDFIEGFISSDELREQVAVPTRQSILKHIRAVFKRQVTIGRLKNDPTAGLYIKKRKTVSYPTTMTEKEIFKVVSYARDLRAIWSVEWSYVYEVAYYTGARSGELYALEWENVILDGEGIDRILIKKSYDWKTETLKGTKGKKDRVVPVNKPLKKVLKKLKEMYPSSSFVLPRIPDWKQGKSAEVLRGFQLAVGIKPTKFHAIRGSTITNLLIKGQPLVKVQSLCGHDQIQTTMLYLGAIGRDVEDITNCLSLTNNLLKADFKNKKKRVA